MDMMKNERNTIVLQVYHPSSGYKYFVDVSSEKEAIQILKNRLHLIPKEIKEKYYLWRSSREISLTELQDDSHGT